TAPGGRRASRVPLPPRRARQGWWTNANCLWRPLRLAAALGLCPPGGDPSTRAARRTPVWQRYGLPPLPPQQLIARSMHLTCTGALCVYCASSPCGSSKATAYPSVGSCQDAGKLRACKAPSALLAAGSPRLQPASIVPLQKASDTSYGDELDAS